MPKPYSREYDYDLPEEENNDNATTTQETNTTPQDDSWARRYADLRRHQQQQERELKAEIEALKQAPANAAPPKTKEDLEAWMRKYPDVAGLVRTLVLQELEPTRNEVKTIRSQTSEERHKAAVLAAQRALAGAHPDFFNDILRRPDFEAWIGTKSQAVYDALYVNELDWQQASEVIDLYKADLAKKGKNSFSNRDAARDVPNRTASTRVGDGTEPTWSESDIEAMSAADFERNEEAINKAYREGRIILDLSGGAR